MCHYITLSFPDSCNLKELSSVFLKYHKPLNDLKNEYIENQLPVGYKYYQATHKECDCGTGLGYLHRSDKEKGNDIEKEINKLRKKGWSEAKINRWKEEQTRNFSKKERIVEDRRNQKSQDAEEWLHLISDILKSTISSSFGLILHWYKSGVSNEHVKIKETIHCSLSDLSVTYLREISEDNLYLFYNPDNV